MSGHRDLDFGSDQRLDAPLRPLRGGAGVTEILRDKAAALAPSEVARRFVTARRTARAPGSRTP